MRKQREPLAAWMVSNGYATGHGDSIIDLVCELDWQHQERMDALKRLTAEVAGLIGITEPELRSLVGNTNLTCLKNRFLDARAAIAKAEGANQ